MQPSDSNSVRAMPRWERCSSAHGPSLSSSDSACLTPDVRLHTNFCARLTSEMRNRIWASGLILQGQLREPDRACDRGLLQAHRGAHLVAHRRLEPWLVEELAAREYAGPL